MVIYLSSVRPAKVDGARDAIAAMAAVDARFGSAEIRCVDLGDAGPSMPMTEEAIIAGAGRRVSALLDRIKSAASTDWYAVGLEGGLDPVSLDPGGRSHALKTWACVSDGRRWSWGAGDAVILPVNVAAEVAAGRELGDVIDSHAGAGVRGTRGAWGVLTRDLITRRDAFKVAVISAFAPFFNPELYTSRD